MENQLLTNEDLEYLVSQSNSNLNMIVSSMTAMMEDNNAKVAMMENQTWFQRMSKTISGSNKMTQEEIARNHDKINLYMTQALGELFNRNTIDHELILGLGNRINELYESQIEIKEIIGAFALKLNEKIVSIDNYHMLVTEINQGLYSSQSPFLAISKILSQLDTRSIEDDRKMDILKRALIENGIITDVEIPLVQVLSDLISISENEAGVLSLFFGNIREEYIAEIIESTLYSYYLLPEKVRKMKSKKAIVEKVLEQNEIDMDYKISTAELSEMLVQAYIDNVRIIKIENEENKMQYIIDYMGECWDWMIEIIEILIEHRFPCVSEIYSQEKKANYGKFIERIAILGEEYGSFRKEIEQTVKAVNDCFIKCINICEDKGLDLQSDEKINLKIDGFDRNFWMMCDKFDIHVKWWREHQYDDPDDFIRMFVKHFYEYYKGLEDDQIVCATYSLDSGMYDYGAVNILKISEYIHNAYKELVKYDEESEKKYLELTEGEIDELYEQLKANTIKIESSELKKIFNRFIGYYDFLCLADSTDLHYDVPSPYRKLKEYSYYDYGIRYAEIKRKDIDFTTIMVLDSFEDEDIGTLRLGILENSGLRFDDDSEPYVIKPFAVEWYNEDEIEIYYDNDDDNRELGDELILRICKDENPEVVVILIVQVWVV